MDGDEFLQQCIPYSVDEKYLFAKAISFAKELFSKKKRLAGDTQYDHNIRVALVLVENKADPSTIVTSILHGILEQKTEDEIVKEFGNEVFHLLKEVEEHKDLKLKNTNLEAETLRKILLTTQKDMRVILIRLAKKIDNLRTIDVLPLEDQKRIAEEVLSVYSPLAYRLGMEKIKVQLEDLTLKILHPDYYQEISSYLEESREEREKKIDDAIHQINAVCSDKVVISKIKGRPKNLYSIYRKLTKLNTPLKEQYDLLGVRIIVDDIKDCYTVLGLLHQNFEPIEGRLKDYITNPKPNFYRSIHTGLKLPNNNIVEVQIRTKEMDEFAEEGLAAHWRYKGIKSDQNFEKKMAWLRGVLDLQKDQNEFLETVKVDVFGDKIYCYTPKGDVKELPIRATLLDFAYMVHEQIGNRAVAGRVNGKFVPLKQVLQAGDVVEIITNKNQRPRRNWLKIVTSAKSRQKIIKSLKEHEELAPLHFRLINNKIKEDVGLLTESPEFQNATCTLAKCCQAIPGDPIIGIVTKRRIISTHKEDCRVALKEQNRWVPAQWRETFNQKIKFYVDAKERSGLLADLLHTIATAGFEVKEAKAKLRGQEIAECSFLVIPRDLEDLKQMVLRVQKVNGVKKIYFD